MLSDTLGLLYVTLMHVCRVYWLGLLYVTLIHVCRVYWLGLLYVTLMHVYSYIVHVYLLAAVYICPLYGFLQHRVTRRFQKPRWHLVRC